ALRHRFRSGVERLCRNEGQTGLLPFSGRADANTIMLTETDDLFRRRIIAPPFWTKAARNNQFRRCLKMHFGCFRERSLREGLSRPKPRVGRLRCKEGSKGSDVAPIQSYRESRVGLEYRGMVQKRRIF